MIEEMIQSRQERARATLGASEAEVERGLELHKNSFVCDCFAFTPGGASRKELAHVNRIIDEGAEGEEAQEAAEDARTVSAVRDSGLRKAYGGILEAAGVDCLVSTVGVGPRMRRGLRHVARYTYLADHMGDTLSKSVAADGVRRNYDGGRRSIVWSANSTPAMGPYEHGYDMLRWLETYYYLGMRMMHLTYNRRNWIGDGCTEPTDVGLSAFGREVVAKLNEMGIIVDTPHSGRQTTLDAAKFSKAPIMASHTGAEGVHKNPRCKSDEEIKAIADTGGLIGVFILPSLLAPTGQGDINKLMEHIDYIAKLVGPDHVCIGSDSAFSVPSPENFEAKPRPASRTKWWSLWNPGDLSGDPNQEGGKGSLAWVNWPYFTVGLVKLGYSDDDIRKMIGGNFLRVLEAVQAAAGPRFRDD